MLANGRRLEIVRIGQITDERAHLFRRAICHSAAERENVPGCIRFVLALEGAGSAQAGSRIGGAGKFCFGSPPPENIEQPPRAQRAAMSSHR